MPAFKSPKELKSLSPIASPCSNFLATVFKKSRTSLSVLLTLYPKILANLSKNLLITFLVLGVNCLELAASILISSTNASSVFISESAYCSAKFLALSNKGLPSKLLSKDSTNLSATSFTLASPRLLIKTACAASWNTVPESA